MSFQIGDRVQCTHDAARAEELASGHGGWVSSMAKCVGKVGTVEQVDSDGDIKVDCSGTNFLWNPRCWSRAEAIGVGSRVTLAPSSAR